MTQYKIVREVTLKYKTGEKVENYKLDNPEAVHEFLKNKIGDEGQENLVTMNLNNKNEVQSWSLTSRGTVSETIVHPREIFKYAIMSNASNIIMAHNHPSGYLTPSRQDIQMTLRMVEVGLLIGIPVLDHIVIDHSGYVSLRESGYI